MGDMTGGDYFATFFAVAGLVIKEHVGTKGFKNGGFLQAAEELALIQTDIPLPQGTNHPLVRRR